ncbi:hypothetical protein Bca101_025987 [Brassica carinata]
MSMKANGKPLTTQVRNAAADKGSNRSHPASHVISANRFNLMMFRDITYGPQEAELRFRLLHFWEARVRVLLHQEESTSSVPVKKRCSLQFGELLWIEKQCLLHFGEPFRFYSIEEFEANCDAKGDLYEYDWETNHRVSEVATSRRMVVHIQPHEGPVMKLYLWDNAAIEFCQKFRAFESPPSVVLVTTVNPKRLGGTLALSSMSSSRVFFDGDVQPTRDYLAWLVSHPDVVNQVNAEVVTKRETATIGEIFAYMKQESAKPAFFECTATIDDVVHDAAWYYIGCGGCKTKATRGATSLMCGKCGKNDITGRLGKYLAKLSVYDKSEEAVFVLLGDAGTELTGKPVLSWPMKTRKLELMCLFQKLYLAQFAFTAPSIEEPLLTADGDGVILEGSEVTATMGAKELGDGTEFGNDKRVKRGD